MKKSNWTNYWSIAILTFSTILVAAAAILWGYMQNDRNNQDYTRLGYTGDKAPITDTYTFPAEFEKQQAVWLQWPSEVYNQPGRQVNPVMINVIKALSTYIRVNIAARNSDEIALIKSLLKESGYKGTSVYFYRVNHLSIWARDVGPVFVKDRNSKLSVVNFGFNNYSRDGNKTYIDTESQVDKLIAGLYGFPIINTTLISEGGAIESNGKGTLMLTESVVLTRNPGLSKQQIENEYKRVLGVSKIVWLKKGLAEDDRITGGHINEIARFAAPNTILLAKILPGDRYTNLTSQESYTRMEENYNILKNSTDQDGKAFKIIRVPVPPTAYTMKDANGNIPIWSYLNYAVTNGAVLMQTYWKPGRSEGLKATEEGVKEILKGVFPGRTLIGINAESVNLWGGGIHCITQHMPAN